MKNILLLLTLCSGIHLFAQQEFAPIGAQWTYNAEFDDDSISWGSYSLSFYRLECTGDSLIQNMNFRKVGPYLMHQEGDQVYYWRDSALQLIYDFGVQAGDTVEFKMLEPLSIWPVLSEYVVAVTMIVDKVDTIQVGTLALKRVTCVNLSHFKPEIYVYAEKIGSFRVLVENRVDNFFVPGFHEDWLRCYAEPGVLEYKTPDFVALGDLSCDATSSAIEPTSRAFNISPNPVTNELSLRADTRARTARLWSVNGLPVLETPLSQGQRVLNVSGIPAGVYLLELRDEKGRRLGVERVLKM